MKNKEKFAKEIVEIACNGCDVAVCKTTGKPIDCGDIVCSKCSFAVGSCTELRKEWAESEYIEKSVISKKDRAFLDYLKDYKCVARDDDGKLYAYTFIPKKILACACWSADGDCKNLAKLDIDFPMIKWEDNEPWLIEDLKKLEVCEEYEID